MRASTIFVLGFTYLFFASCFPNSIPKIAEEAQVDLAGTKWSLDSRYGIDATIEFNQELTVASGSDGCNTFNSDLELKYFLMELSKFTNTQKTCTDIDDVDRDYLVALSKVRDYEVSKKNLSLFTLGLVYLGEKSTNILKFDRIEE